jgi:hypothetical protein
MPLPHRHPSPKEGGVVEPWVDHQRVARVVCPHRKSVATAIPLHHVAALHRYALAPNPLVANWCRVLQNPKRGPHQELTTGGPYRKPLGPAVGRPLQHPNMISFSEDLRKRCYAHKAVWTDLTARRCISPVPSPA